MQSGEAIQIAMDSPGPESPFLRRSSAIWWLMFASLAVLTNMPGSCPRPAAKALRRCRMV
jgi:hypothetical protein